VVMRCKKEEDDFFGDVGEDRAIESLDPVGLVEYICERSCVE
jgi:hypothetical protein